LEGKIKLSLIDVYKNIIGKPACLYKKRNFEDKVTHIKRIDIELVENCNLNCKGCNHFSPIAENEEISIENLGEQLAQLYKVMGDYFEEVSLLGGEPLLHSDICGCVKTAREAIHDKKLVMVTNGILLPKQNENFWEVMCENKVEIEITKYPIKLPYDEMEKTAKNKGVTLKYFGRSGYVQKTQYTLPLDTTGKQNKDESFKKCFMARQCYTLRNGDIYPCPIAACIERFNKTFGENIPLTELDGGNIFNESAEDILNKLSFPIPMCSYCKAKERTYGNKWGTSKRSIEEWS
jgi:MoaA/NifB/PqqE/SkfB family radical SAM enzyme